MVFIRKKKTWNPQRQNDPGRYAYYLAYRVDPKHMKEVYVGSELNTENIENALIRVPKEYRCDKRRAKRKEITAKQLLRRFLRKEGIKI